MDFIYCSVVHLSAES